VLARAFSKPAASGDGVMRHGERQRSSTEPKGELALRTLAMPADSNPKGDIFGGWIMALMDSAGKMSATPHAGGRVVTVAVSNITFLQPVHVGDTVCCYTDVKRIGRTSITLDVEVWVLRQGQGERVRSPTPSSPLSRSTKTAAPATSPLQVPRGGGRSAIPAAPAVRQKARSCRYRRDARCDRVNGGQGKATASVPPPKRQSMTRK
jgi:acyl-CoA thioesterase YciA